jgi:ferric-dicitrate binding protein FerR (iron transport regulator)
MEKYRDYTAVDFLNDESFLRWISEPTQKENDFWNNFLKTHPYKKADIKEATLVFKLFYSRENKLALNEQYDLWKKIQDEAKNSKRTIFLKLAKYAAILILVFFSGAVTYYLYQDGGQQYQYELAETPQTTKDEAMIVLSDGSQISLEKQMSQISYSQNGQQLIVNNDTITQKTPTEGGLINKIIIPYGKKSMIMLSDGSKVWLNAGSQLIYPSVFSEKTRQVMLVGEAFFDVAKNTKKPFIVRTTDISIHVLGTRFDISAYPEDKLIQTVLVEGKVNLTYSGKGILNREYSVEMKPNQMVVVNKSTGESRSQTVDVSKFVSWKDGMLEFEKVDLVRALKQVERYYNVRIQLADPMIGSFKLSGKLDLKEEPEEVLNVIKLTVPIDWQKKSNGDFIIINKE